MRRDHFAIVHYEDLSDHTQTVTARLFDLLGVDDEREVKTDMAKIHKDIPTRNYFKEEQREELRHAGVEEDEETIHRYLVVPDGDRCSASDSTTTVAISMWQDCGTVYMNMCR